MSVKLTTPDKWPLMFCPGRADAGTEVVVGEAGMCARVAETVPNVLWARAGVDGIEEAGEGLSGESTIHMRCERVATSFATVWARVEDGEM